jgi:NADH dehydrogenase
MSPDTNPIVTVLGGTGFLGRRAVERLAAAGWRVRVACRHPGGAEAGEGRVPVETDIRDARSVAAALEGARCAVNAVSLYVERGDTTFDAIHVEAAGRVAAAAREAGVSRLVHLSGIGADPSARSAYIRARGEGEGAVRSAFPGATIFRPSVMTGPDDAFLTTLAGIVRRLPVIPLFGRGETRLQPVFVGDVAEAAARALTRAEDPPPLLELGGPEAVRYGDLLRRIAREEGRRRLFLPVPFALWEALAAAVSVLPEPPVTRAQIALMRLDNVADPAQPGLADLGVSPTPLARVLADVLDRPARG